MECFLPLNPDNPLLLQLDLPTGPQQPFLSPRIFSSSFERRDSSGGLFQTAFLISLMGTLGTILSCVGLDHIYGTSRKILGKTFFIFVFRISGVKPSSMFIRISEMPNNPIAKGTLYHDGAL